MRQPLTQKNSDTWRREPRVSGVRRRAAVLSIVSLVATNSRPLRYLSISCVPALFIHGQFITWLPTGFTSGLPHILRAKSQAEPDLFPEWTQSQRQRRC